MSSLTCRFEDYIGQSYDNGANMKGKHKVLTRLLKINPRAEFVPHEAHTLNVVIADAAKSSKGAVGFLSMCKNSSPSFQRAHKDLF